MTAEAQGLGGTQVDHSGHGLSCALISLGDLPVLWIPDMSPELKFMSRRLHIGLELLF